MNRPPRHVTRAAAVVAEQDQQRREFQAEREATDTLAGLAAGIRAAHEAARQAFGSALTHAIEAGRLLIAAKKQIAHGEWLPWLEKNADLTRRTAQLYMRLSRNESKLGSNAQRVAHFSIREAVAAISNEQQRLARLPAPILDEVFNETTDETELKGVLRQAENRHQYNEWRRQEDVREAAQQKRHYEVEEVEFEATWTKAEKTFVSKVTWAIDALVHDNPDLSPQRITDLLNAAGCASLGERWDQ